MSYIIIVFPPNNQSGKIRRPRFVYKNNGNIKYTKKLNGNADGNFFSSEEEAQAIIPEISTAVFKIIGISDCELENLGFYPPAPF